MRGAIRVSEPTPASVLHDRAPFETVQPHGCERAVDVPSA